MATIKKSSKKKPATKRRVVKRRETRKTGRPSKYNPEYCDEAYKLCLLGAIDSQIADFFNVAESTLNLWKKEHAEFSESLKRGKISADAVVAQSLFHRANGYSHPEDKIFNNGGEEMVIETTKHYPPDTTAAIFWLKNRRSSSWRDKTEHEHTGKDGGPIETKTLTVVGVGTPAKDS